VLGKKASFQVLVQLGRLQIYIFLGNYPEQDSGRAVAQLSRENRLSMRALFAELDSHYQLLLYVQPLIFCKVVSSPFFSLAV